MGLVEGLRTAGNGLKFNSLYAAGGYWRCLSAAAATMLFYAALFFLMALALGWIMRSAERWMPLPWHAMQAAGTAAALQTGMLMLMEQGHRLFPSPVLAGSCALGWAAFAVWLAAEQKGLSESAARAALALAFASAVMAFFDTYISWDKQFDFRLHKTGFLACSLIAGGLLFWAYRHLLKMVLATFSFLAVLTAAGMWAPVALEAEPSTAEGEALPPIILITVDTLRRDAISCYNAEVMTPALQALAGESAVFEMAYAPAPWTLPSLYSMLTSRHPHELRCGGVGDYCLDGEVLTIPAYLKNYQSHAVVTNIFNAGTPGLWRGFRSYESGDSVSPPLDAVLDLASVRLARRSVPPLVRDYGVARAEAVTSHAIEQVRAGGRSNLFLWLHYMDPHAPYNPPEPFRPPGHEENGTEKQELHKLPTFELRQGMSTNAGERQRLRSLYAGEVRYLDSQLGRLFDFLKTERIWDECLIIFSSDHGEEFWEHGGAGHGHTLYEELLQIPLLIKLPRSEHAGRRIAEPASLLDVLPTILDVAGVEAPEGAPIRGRSLLPLLGGNGHEARPLYFEAPAFYGERKGWLDWPWKMIYDPATENIQLFHLEEDGGETRNLVPQEARRTALYREAIQPYLDAERAQLSKDSLGDETKKRLKALGYLQ
jgi:arylsulfatase A-like enzyme